MKLKSSKFFRKGFHLGAYLSVVSLAGTIVIMSGYSISRYANFGGKDVTLVSGVQQSVLNMVQNHTSSVQVVNAVFIREADTNYLRIQLRNNSPDKVLTAYVLSFGDANTRVEREFFFSESPADIFGPGALINDEFEGVDPEKPIIIGAAIFDESIFEGGRKEAASVINKRIGEKILLSTVLKSLRVLKETDSDDERMAMMSRITTSAMNTPDPKEQELAPYRGEIIDSADGQGVIEWQVGRGMRLGSELILQRLQQIEEHKRFLMSSDQAGSAENGKTVSRAFKEDVERLIKRCERLGVAKYQELRRVRDR